MDNLKEIWARIRTATLLLFLFAGIGPALAPYIPKAEAACDARCYSVTCATSACDGANIFCSDNCRDFDICLQEVGYCTNNQNPCMCGLCVPPAFCN